jgi:hypothetical protein
MRHFLPPPEWRWVFDHVVEVNCSSAGIYCLYVQVERARMYLDHIDSACCDLVEVAFGHTYPRISGSFTLGNSSYNKLY